jgi:hypothetical protein
MTPATSATLIHIYGVRKVFAAATVTGYKGGRISQCSLVLMGWCSLPFDLMAKQIPRLIRSFWSADVTLRPNYHKMMMSEGR